MSATLDEGERIWFGIYKCQRCGKEYTVNEPDSWRQCTPEFCHGCTEHLNKQSALLPYPEPMQ